MATRRNFLEKSTQLAAGALAAVVMTTSTSEAQTQQPQAPKKKLHILMRSSWGTDEPTRASFVFDHGLALADAGHEVQIFLTHDATYLMRKETLDAIKHIGWPPLSETMAKVVAKGVPIFSCGACSRARGITEADLRSWNAQWGSPAIYVSLVEWADHIISE
ncbi:MAG TPA: DsrE family protein [Acidobacteriaceae bacterium]|nr:DsrE family protein [Acidobacteriaceae bacterium]